MMLSDQSISISTALHVADPNQVHLMGQETSAADQKGRRGWSQGLLHSLQEAPRTAPPRSLLPLAPPAREVFWPPAGLIELHLLFVPLICLL